MKKKKNQAVEKTLKDIGFIILVVAVAVFIAKEVLPMLLNPGKNV